MTAPAYPTATITRGKKAIGTSVSGTIFGGKGGSGDHGPLVPSAERSGGAPVTIDRTSPPPITRGARARTASTREKRDLLTDEGGTSHPHPVDHRGVSTLRLVHSVQAADGPVAVMIASGSGGGNGATSGGTSRHATSLTTPFRSDGWIAHG